MALGLQNDEVFVGCWGVEGMEAFWEDMRFRENIVEEWRM